MIENKIDFIMVDKSMHASRDISVINTGNYHRLVRVTLNKNFMLERTCLIETTLRPILLQAVAGSERFHIDLKNRFYVLQTECDVHDDLRRVMEVMNDVG